MLNFPGTRYAGRLLRNGRGGGDGSDVLLFIFEDSHRSSRNLAEHITTRKTSLILYIIISIVFPAFLGTRHAGRIFCDGRGGGDGGVVSLFKKTLLTYNNMIPERTPPQDTLL